MRTGLDHDPGDRVNGGVSRKGLSNAELRRRVDKQMMIDNAEKRQAIREKMPRNNLIRFSLLALAVIVIAGLVVWNVSASSSHNDKVSANADRIVDLRDQLNESKNDETSVKPVDSVISSMDSARKAGEGLMGIQNRMRELKMTPESWDADLAAYSGMTDEAKEFMVASATNSGDFLANGQWFLPYNVGSDAEGASAVARMPASDWAWRMEPVGANTDGAGTVPVIWRGSYTGGDRNGLDMVWVTANYHQDSGKFDNFVRGYTVEGSNHLAMSISKNPEVDSDDLDETAPNDAEALGRIAQETLDRAQRQGGSTGSGNGNGADAPDAPAGDDAGQAPADDPRVAGNQSAQDFQNGGRGRE